MFWNNWFKAPDLTTGTPVSNSWLFAQVIERIPNAILNTPLDKKYLVQPNEVLQRIVAGAWDETKMVYHGNGPEFPDCDDFAIACAGAVRVAAFEHGLKHGPAFGLIGLRLKGGRPHLMNIAVFEDGAVELFEPQSGMWHNDLSVIEVVRWILF